MVAGALANLSGLYLGTLPVTPNNKNQLAARLAVYDTALGELGSVTVYGTAGDGTTDDYAEIQSAITAAVALGCGLVLLPAGRFKVSNCLAVTGSKITIAGQGIGVTTIVGAAGAYAGVTDNGTDIASTIAAVGRNHVTIRDLTIDHLTNSTAANGIAFVPATAYNGTVCTDVKAINVEVRDALVQQKLAMCAAGCAQELADEGHDPTEYAEVVDLGLLHVYEVSVYTRPKEEAGAA